MTLIIYNTEFDIMALFSRNIAGVTVETENDFIYSKTTTLKKWRNNGWRIIGTL